MFADPHFTPLLVEMRSDQRILALVVGLATALDNGFTKPPMGWSALYGAPFGSVNETLFSALRIALMRPRITLMRPRIAALLELFVRAGE